METPNQVSQYVQFRTLDSLDLPFLYVSSAREPLFLSSRGAKALEIRNRQELPKHKALLEPLISAASSAMAPSRATGIIRLNDQSHLSEADLETAAGRRFPALVFAKSPMDNQALEGIEPLDGAFVVFHDLTLLEPFFKMIDQARKNRALIVLGSSILRYSLAVDSDTGRLVDTYQEAEKEFFQHSVSPGENLMQTDLLAGLSAAVDIIDPLIVSSAKILVDVKTPALLDISWPNFLRVICHLLLEAADFVGPFGTTKIRLVFDHDEKKHSESSLKDAAAEIIMLAERQTNIPVDASPLELYIYRRYMPLHYKVTTTETSSQRRAPSGILKAFPQQAKAGWLEENSSVAPESLSDNLQIASHIARACDVAIDIRRPFPKSLLLSARFKLCSE